jgi:dienelactone hydrolase
MAQANPEPQPPPADEHRSAERAAGQARQGRRRGIKIARSCARGLLALLFFVGAGTSLVPWGRAAARGVLLLPPLLTTSQPAPFVAIGEGVRHTALTIPYASGSAYLDVYEPTTPAPLLPGARGGLLIIPGVTDSRADPGLVNLSESLARSGAVVMDMTTPTLIAADVSPDDADAVVRAFERLASWPGVGSDRVGIIGISGGGPLACLAAVDPRIRDRVAFITQYAGFYNVQDMLRDIGRRAIMVDGRLESWVPIPLTLSVMANVLAPTLPAPDGPRLAQGFDYLNPNPLSPDEVAQLSPEGAAAYHLLQGDQPDNVDANIAVLLRVAGDLFTQLSPSSVISRIRAPIYLLHDRADPSIPVTEARDFAAALTRLGHPHDYVELNILAHAEIRGNLSPFAELGGGIGLARILFDVLLVGS